MLAAGLRDGRLACTVRGCTSPLSRAGPALRCERGHAFDLARAGYVNLLQPQDRRSAVPGDAPGLVEARLRLAAAGADHDLRAAVARWSDSPAIRGAGGALLEVGSGPGLLLGELARDPSREAYGLDLSLRAVARAARAYPRAGWIVANADRRLPFLDASLSVLISMRGPKNPGEFARVLLPGGHLLLGVPGVDDLGELRRATAGGELPRDPAERALAAFAARFELVGRWECRQRLALDRGGLGDLLATVYRGARWSEARRAAELEGLTVTQATVLLHLRAARAR